MPSVRLRILSDLHFAERASRIENLAMIRPLLEGAEQLIFNGDSIDTRFLDREPSMAAGRDQFLEFIAPYRDRLTLITGNHDPDISLHHHLELAGGRILVTHGDVLFPSVAPWGWEAPHVLAVREQKLAGIASDERDRFETQLAICKHASYATRHLSPTAHGLPTSTWARILHLATRVRRADKIISSWFQAPALASRLAAQHRPGAELVIFGHTHFPGVWRRKGRIVINTGAFTPPFSARVVDIVDGRVDVRAVTRRGREFHAGKVIRTLQPGRDFAASLV